MYQELIMSPAVAAAVNITREHLEQAATAAVQTELLAEQQ